MSENKNAYLILRVQKEFKDRLVVLAIRNGKNLSEFLREALEELYEKK